MSVNDDLCHYNILFAVFEVFHSFEETGDFCSIMSSKHLLCITHIAHTKYLVTDFSCDNLRRTDFVPFLLCC